MRPVTRKFFPCTQTQEYYIYTYRRPESISTRPDNPNTLTHKSVSTNYATRVPLHGPVKWNPASTWPYSMLRLRLHLHIKSVTIITITATLRQEPVHCCIRYPTLAPSSASADLCWQPFLTGFDSIVFDLIRLTCFSIYKSLPPVGLKSSTRTGDHKIYQRSIGV